MPAPVSVAAPGAVAGDLLGRMRAELPVIGELGEREQLLVSAWLTGLRSARTRRAYAADVAAWLGWFADRGTGALAAGRVHVNLWAATQWSASQTPPSVPITPAPVMVAGSTRKLGSLSLPNEPVPGRTHHGPFG